MNKQDVVLRIIDLTKRKCPKNSGIYLIRSKINDKIYIGGCINIRDRILWGHLYRLENNIHINKKLQKHVNIYGINDLEFGIIEFCTKEVLLQKEQFWMDQFHPKFNISPTAGSQLGFNHDDLTKLKLSKSHKGKKLTVAHCESISNAQKGHFTSNETKIKIGNANRGSILGPMPEETKKKLSIAHIGLLKGTHLSEEHKKLLSIKAKLRPSNRKGCKLSQETINKMKQTKMLNKLKNG